MTSVENCSDSDNENLTAEDTLIGKILIQMKSTFNNVVSIKDGKEEKENLTVIENNSESISVNTVKKSAANNKLLLVSENSGVIECNNCEKIEEQSLLTNRNVPNDKLENEVQSDTVEKETLKLEDSEQLENEKEQNNQKNITVEELVSIAPINTEELAQIKVDETDELVNEKEEVEKKSLLFTAEVSTFEEKKKKRRGRLPGRRSLRKKSASDVLDLPNTQEVKRSSRRLSKDCGETVLQSAIARKEKSYNETARPQRLSRRRLKPISNGLEATLETKMTRNKRISLNNPLIKNKANEDCVQNSISVANVESSEVFLKNDESVSLSTEGRMQNTKILKLGTNRKLSESSKENKKSPSPLQPDNTEENTLEPTELKTEFEHDRRKSFSSSTSSSSENKRTIKRRKTNVDETDGIYNTGASATSVRRRSHRRPGSPHVAEQAENIPPNQPTECGQLQNEPEPAQKRCLCLKRTRIVVEYQNTKEIFCTAVDSIDGKTIGCNNLINMKEVRRASTRVPFLILCNSHFQRLLRHNCCPGCGMFCTEGVFAQCFQGHLYHRNCIATIDWNFAENFQADKNLIYCLHCGDNERQNSVQLTIRTAKKPIFLPFQRSYYPAAKITLQKSNKRVNSQLITDNGITLEIESENIPVPKLYPMNINGSVHFSPDHLYEAAEQGDISKLLEILACGIDVQQNFDSFDGDTALHAACANGHKIAAYILLTAGASINALNASQKTPLMLSVLSFHDDILSFLIKNNATVSFKGPDGMTALHLAAKIGNLNATKILLTAPNLSHESLIDEKDDGGWTALVWACEHAHANVAKYLLWRGADPNIRDLEHNVPLHWAAFGGDYEIMHALLNAGVDANAINVHKESPLHIAARQDRYDCVVMLLAHKAIPDAVNSDGETPLDCCNNNSSTIEADENISTEKSNDCKNLILWNIQLRSLFVSTLKRDPILSNDLTKGKELNPIQCVNYVDNESIPTDFVYITENCLTSDISIDRKITTLQACTCNDRCGTLQCQCNNLSLRCWYDDQERLLPEFDYVDPPMIFECNQRCACNVITCRNRVVQRGLTQRFQIFRTETKGWGVRTLRFIKRGTYVCEYIGEILSDLEADQREDDSYLFDLDSREGETYCIDARKYGNLARFINHHCSPNLLPVRVFIDHHDLHFPRIAFFANRDIAADEELGFDYGEKFWIIKCKSFTCTCGASNCRYSETTIESTLKAYQLKEEQLALQQQQLVAVV